MNDIIQDIATALRERTGDLDHRQAAGLLRRAAPMIGQAYFGGRAMREDEAYDLALTPLAKVMTATMNDVVPSGGQEQRDLVERAALTTTAIAVEHEALAVMLDRSLIAAAGMIERGVGVSLDFVPTPTLVEIAEQVEAHALAHPDSRIGALEAAGLVETLMLTSGTAPTERAETIRRLAFDVARRSADALGGRAILQLLSRETFDAMVARMLD